MPPAVRGVTSTSFEDFGAAKAEGKYKTGLPVLTLPSGQEVTQSSAMLRFAGSIGADRLYPSDPSAALICDSVIDTCQDALTKCPQVRVVWYAWLAFE